MRKVLMPGIYPYSVKEGTRFFRHQVCPVEAFPVLAANQLELLAVNEFVFSILIEVGENEFDTDVFLRDLLDIQSNFSPVIMS